MKKISLCIFALFALAGCDSLPSWMGGAEKAVVRLPGERLDVLPAGPQFKADDAVQGVAFQLPASIDNASWAQATDQFTAKSANLALPGDLSTHQDARIGDGDRFVHTLIPRPVVAGGFVYAMDASGHISAHDVNNIDTIAWVSEALVNKHVDQVMGGGLAVDNGKLYASSGRGQITAIDATKGETLWTISLGIPLRSAPRVSGDTLYIISIDSQTFALDVATGKTRWTHRGINETAGLMNTVSPSLGGGMLIAPYTSGELYALHAENGDEAWRSSLVQANRTSATAIFAGIGGDPVVDESVVFGVSNGGMFSVLNLLTGQPLWNKPIAAINTPWVVGEYVFVLSEDNVLMAMVKYDGRIRWTTQLPRFKDEKRKLKPILWRGPVMANGKLLISGSNGQLLNIDPSAGTTLSTLETEEEIYTSPVVAGGKIFLVGKDARLYSFQ